MKRPVIGILLGAFVLAACSPAAQESLTSDVELAETYVLPDFAFSIDSFSKPLPLVVVQLEVLP